MAIIKCKMCGGDLNLVEGSTVCECEYCGTKQTVPSADNEKKLTLFGRAGRLLRACEFDKAAGVFETIVADFPQEAEAYWGLVLCKYGIEYVDDPATGKKIPTCHRSSFDSVLDDANFEQACENTDAVARRVYRDEARQIEELRQAILQVSGKEEPYDVFISYKETDANGERTLDSVIAQDIYKELTNEGYRVFFSRISLEDKLGTEYEPYIFAALNSAKVMLVVGTDYENFDAVWVKNEWSRFLKLIAKGEKKTLIPVFKNMDAYDMPKEFAKLSAQDMGKVGAMQDLVRGVEKIVGKKKAEATVPVQQPMYVSNEADVKTAAAVKRGYMALEDSDWNKAKVYFDQALALDAECAEAYLGLFLADEKCSNEGTYISCRCDIRPEQEKKSLLPDRERVEDAVRTYAVPGFLSEEQIRDLFRVKLIYDSDVKGAETIAEQEKVAFRSNRNLTRAIRFAKNETKARLDGFQSTLFSRLDDKVEEAKQREAAAEDEETKAYEAHLAATEQRLIKLHHNAEEKRDTEYQAACNKQAAAKTIAEYQNAIGMFLQVEGYRDSDERTAQCRAAIEDLNEQERQRKEAEAKAAAEEDERQRILAEKKRKARNKKIGSIAGVVAAAVLAVFLIEIKVVIPGNRYKSAEALLENGDKAQAAITFAKVGSYKDAQERCFEIWEQLAPRESFAAGAVHTVGLKADGAVIAVGAVGREDYGQCDVSNWTDIVSVAAGAAHTVGLKADGTVVAVGSNDYGQCDVSSWTDIVAVAAGGWHTVGLKADGTVVAVGDNNDGQCNVSNWSDIVAVTGGNAHTVGLKADGTVVAVGNNEDGQCNVSNWTDIVAVAAGREHTVGLKADGTVVAVGDNKYGQRDVSNWTDIVAIAAASAYTVGLKEDGTVVSVGHNGYGECDVSDWTDIVAVAAGGIFSGGLNTGPAHTVGLKADGTVVAVGNNEYGQCDVSNWGDIKLPNT